MRYWVEIRSTLRRTTKVTLVPISEISKHTGFRSVYAYPDNLADQIIENNSTAFLQNQEVYSDELLVDFDTDDCIEFRQFLRDQGYGWREYTTGNRGSHFHIAIEPMFGSWVPVAQKRWVSEHAPGADVSFYHTSGIFRLPRTFHYKAPGKCKQIVEEQPGRLLRIPKPDMPKMSVPITKKGEATVQDVHILMLQTCGVGHRQPHVWKIAITAAEAGLPYEEAVQKCLWWNDNYCNPPHPETVIHRQCESAYTRKRKEELWQSNGQSDTSNFINPFHTTQT